MATNNSAIFENAHHQHYELYPALSNNSSTTWEVAFLDMSRFWVQRILVPIVVIVGVLGNAVTIYILTRRPMRSSTNV